MNPMPRVFKKSIVRRLDADGQRVPSGTPGARKVKQKSGKWYGRVPGTVKPVPLCRNKSAAEMMLNELVKKTEMGKAGIIDPFEQHRKRPLSEHLDDFLSELQARGDDPRHVAIVGSRLRTLLDECRFTFMDEVSASKIMDYLASLRRDRTAAPLPQQEWFTPREAAAVLGIKAESVGTAVRRHRLDAEGKGKMRRYPRATVEALQDRLCRGVSMQTTNQYLAHIKAFCRWMVKDHRTADNPLSHLEASNNQLDRRHDRRELAEDELRRVLSAARASERTFRGLSGWDRFHLYATACGTGFRASALASLTPESFNLEAEIPTVTLSARRNKSRVLKVQPIPADVAELLRAYLDSKPAGVPLWGGTWAKEGKGAEMLRIDLEAAGIPYSVEGPDGPLFADFHALRHTYLTLGGRAGIDLRTLQELAGHSSPILTARYTHRRLYDLDRDVNKLPNFLPIDGTDTSAGILRATGTDASTTVDVGCSMVAHKTDTAGDSLITVEHPLMEEGLPGRKQKPLVLQGVASDCDLLRAIDSRVGEGTRTPDIQIHSQPSTRRNFRQGKRFGSFILASCTAACTRQRKTA
jgi:integrase